MFFFFNGESREGLRNDVDESFAKIFALFFRIDHFTMCSFENFCIRTSNRSSQSFTFWITYTTTTINISRLSQQIFSVEQKICLSYNWNIRSTSSWRNRSLSLATSLSLFFPGINKGARGVVHWGFARVSGSWGKNLAGSCVPFPLVPSPRRPSRF